MKIAVFASGNGTNLEALIKAEREERLITGKITLVVSDKSGAYALKRAERYGIKTFVLEAQGFASREEYDERLIEELKKEKIELVVLAGFMRILSKPFVEAYDGKILNIHPSKLPAFKGAHAISDAYNDATVSATGVTVHFVTEKLDAGPMILQEEVEITNEDTLTTLEEKIHKVEHKVYPEAVRLVISGHIKKEGG
ncbi:MAG: phosphoribosylglycinamide formyltransferase [Candidatus Omnitrophota bacterium]